MLCLWYRAGQVRVATPGCDTRLRPAWRPFGGGRFALWLSAIGYRQSAKASGRLPPSSRRR